ncbi:MAG TPA: ABC transporter permease, partial [Candidatus Deferrimicrobiaceae bacterium]|nr:ABC transporter permease [Candidatus Deferrimicrobiaceae bacterium]
MKLPDLADLALRNLRESVLRNSLTTIGISVGVASLVAMLSLGIGLQQLASRRLMKSGLFDTVVVTSRRDLRNFGHNEDRNGPAPGESRILDEPTRLEIEHLPNVLEAYPDIRFITELRYDDKPHLTMIAALPSSAKSNDAFDALQGRFFSSDMAPEAVIQKAFAEELLGKTPKSGIDETSVAQLAAPLLGKELTMRYAQRETAQNAASTSPAKKAVGDQTTSDTAYSVVSREAKLTIVGVADLDPESMRGPTRARVFIPLKLAESLHVMQPTDLREVSRAAENQPSYSSVNVRVKSPGEIRNIEDAIKKMGFNTFSILDATRSLQQFFAVLDVFLGIFGSLALAVASIGIVNTLVMAILERRREIGIMKAIGASDGDVK